MESVTTAEQRLPLPRSSRASRSRRLLALLLFFILAMAGAGVAVSFFGTRTYRWRAFTLQVGVVPALTSAEGAGETRLAVPPLGEVRAPTHTGPVVIRAELVGVAIDELKRLALNPPPRIQLERELSTFAGRAARDLALQLLVAGALGGLAAPLLFRSRRFREWLAAPLTGALAVALLLLLVRASFHPEAFRTRSTYTGSLEQAPWAISLAQNAVSNTEALGARLRNVSVNLHALYGRIAATAADPVGEDKDTIRVLHISDIHNNPAAISFVQDLARRFEVAAVIDTGDLTDFGTPTETQAVRGLAGLGVPYLFVPGNHDSQATTKAVALDLKGIVLKADTEPISVAGLRVIGTPDPSSERTGEGSVDTPAEALQQGGEALLARYQSLKPPPDIVCVHNPKEAQPLIGKVPLILCGHLHRAYIDVDEGTILCNAGTTGASGARYFERAEGVPFSAAVLHFSRPKMSPTGTAATPPRLLFIDMVSLDGSLRQYSITRRVFTASEEATPAVGQSPSPTPSESATP